MLGLITSVGAVLLVAWSLRIASWAGAITLGSMSTFALLITLALGAWEVACIAAVVVPLVRRRSYRVHYRLPTNLQARIDRTSTVVAVFDLTPEGISFESPVALSNRVVLLTRLPDTHGEIHDLTLPIQIRWCTPAADTRGFRVGGHFEPLNQKVHERLVEYCFVVQPAQELGAHLSPVTQPSATERAS